MSPLSRYRVLLLSRAPEAHVAVVDSFRRAGAEVVVASEPSRALALLRRRPELALVDLAHRGCLNTAVVRALNQERGSTLVVALHEGRLEDMAEDAHHLSVHGFCRSSDLIHLPHAATGAALPASPVVH